MELPLQTVQDLAPDQKSLAAAKKLINPGKWPMLGIAGELNTIWGQCQGSGANPYLTMADIKDHGYKCTCPSRKFPCKHVLALLWIYSENAPQFAESEPPEWVGEWLSRRRRPQTATKGDAEPQTDASIVKDIYAISDEPALSPEDIAKKAALKQQRASRNRENTEVIVKAGLQELELWVRDQLRTGISGLIKELRPRTRQIAARMVDAKAGNLASRIDELSSKVAGQSLEQQVRIIMDELGTWILISRAWQLHSADPDARRAVQTAESKDELLNGESAKSAIRASGRWLCVGEKVETRRDGLVSHETWLYPLDGQSTTTAKLLDYYPATAGKRQASLRAGNLLQGELIFYPSRMPQRAILADYQLLTDTVSWPDVAPPTPEEQLVTAKTLLPWTESVPLLIGSCTLGRDKAGDIWLNFENQSLPLSPAEITPLMGGDLLGAFVSWNGNQAELLSVCSPRWGTLSC
ncbi:SWIM zinc finger domain-containing protein [Shewanella submarina]|uniref:SWIM zinc finger domain-containing protein n=1 Tax=Shewanella submarina TaxID=2016376 RepID=A0ABV7GHF6_9GAMM|nr:SWIM zinc finger family protein [Shewanella submarina]MCL1038055.1 SWIM zinc finger domain-containing protein [Shewanella submarina]